MSARHSAVRSFRPGRVRIVLGTSVVGATLALGGAVTANAATGQAGASTDAQEPASVSSVASTATGKHAKPYVSGSETPAAKPSAKPATAAKHASPVPTPVGQANPAPAPVGQNYPAPPAAGQDYPAPTPVGQGYPAPTPVGQGYPAPTPVGQGSAPTPYG
ncbi:hypothetical protein AB0H18_47670 [Streptomyces sp. NPDC020766]|uniref:hypothetical protein n=1 Tax=Streptomyces sp. NPDC020766 TaxID=3155011 RepID=UPI0033DCE8F7